MSNQNLLFNELTVNETDAIKGGSGGSKVSRNRNNRFSNNIDSPITSIKDSVVTRDINLGNDSTIGNSNNFSISLTR